MYSVVLMMAISGGAETPDFGRHGCCNGGYGCCSGGYVASNCSGGGCHGGCHGGLFRRHGCHGGGGCCSGGSVGCCSGGYTSGYFEPGPGYQTGPRGEQVGPPRKGQEEVRGLMPGRILVSLPEDARLTINGQATRSTSGMRWFESPPLEPGYDYVYDIEATIMRDGQPVPVKRQVTVRAGQQARVSFAPSGRVSESGIGEEQEFEQGRPLPRGNQPGADQAPRQTQPGAAEQPRGTNQNERPAQPRATTPPEAVPPPAGASNRNNENRNNNNNNQKNNNPRPEPQP